MTPAPSGVVDPDRDTARRWAVEELSGREYVQAQPGLLERVAGAVLGWLEDLLERAGAVGSGTALLVGLALAALLVAVVVLALVLAGPLRRGGRTRQAAGGVFDGAVRSAAEHRAASEREAAAGRWGPALQERFRAAARTLEERVVLDPRPGRTADELAREGGAALPAAAAPLARAARVFDDVTYGEREGTEAGYAACVAADDAVRRERPARSGPPAGPVGGSSDGGTALPVGAGTTDRDRRR